MKKIGIIGGLGPLATVKFLELIKKELKHQNQEAEIVVINDPTTPDRTEYILNNDKPNPINKILDMVNKLNLAKVDVIVMPCNTASYFYKEILDNTNIHFINIVSETVNEIKKLGIKKVALLATYGTVKSQIYETLLEKENIKCIIPDSIGMKITADVIYKKVKQNENIKIDNFYNLIEELKEEGAQKIIFGCTELSALKQIENINDNYIIDAMEILAKNTVESIK